MKKEAINEMKSIDSQILSIDQRLDIKLKLIENDLKQLD
jgi:hypothetical protein